MTHDDTTLQAAIDAAFQTNGSEHCCNLVTSKSRTMYWLDEAPARLNVAKAFLAALPAEADPYAELKAAHAEEKVIQSFNCERGDIWQDCPSPAFEGGTDYRIKPEPVTFEARGKEWTRHTPGDPTPCDGEAVLDIIYRDQSVNTSWEAENIDWNFGDMIGWRYAEQPQLWQPAIGDVVRLKSGGPDMTVKDITPEGLVSCIWFDPNGQYDQTTVPAACLELVRKEKP